MDRVREAICLAMSIAASVSVIGIGAFYKFGGFRASRITQPAPSATAML